MRELAEGREVILKELFGRMGKDCFLEPPLFVDYGCNISLGDGFYANAKYVFCVFLVVSLIYTRRSLPSRLFCLAFISMFMGRLRRYNEGCFVSSLSS